MNPTPSPKQKKVKAWALISKENGYEDIKIHKNYHVLSIFKTKKFALLNKPTGWMTGHIWEVVPVTITYTLPAPLKRKKK